MHRWDSSSMDMDVGHTSNDDTNYYDSDTARHPNLQKRFGQASVVQSFDWLWSWSKSVVTTMKCWWAVLVVAPLRGHSADYDYCYYCYYHRLLSYWLLVFADVDCSEYDADVDYDRIHVPRHFVTNRLFRLHRRLLLPVFLVWVNIVPHPIGIASLE